MLTDFLRQQIIMVAVAVAVFSSGTVLVGTGGTGGPGVVIVTEYFL